MSQPRMKQAGIKQRGFSHLSRIALLALVMLLHANVAASSELATPESTAPESITPESITPESAGPASEASLTPEQQALLAEQQQLEQLAGSVVELSGLTGLGLQARHLAQQTLNQHKAALGYQYQVAGRVAALWSPQQLSERLKQPLANAELAELQQLLALLTDNRMQQAREKENSAVADQDSQAFLGYVQKLRAQPPGAARLQVITELDQAMRFSELLVHTRASVYGQLQAVLKDWQPPENWQANLRNEVQEFLLYTYRRTPNDGIRTLTQLYQQPVLQQWLSAVQQNLAAFDQQAATQGS